MRKYDLIIVGAGAAGMLCAIEGKKSGLTSILVIEKDTTIGGSLNSGDYIISNDNKTTGLDYLEKIKEEYESMNIETYLNTMVLHLTPEGNVMCIHPERGIEEIHGKCVILANGSKEKSRNIYQMPGDRCSGIYSLGTVKKILSVGDIALGRNVVLYGTEHLDTVKNIFAKNKVQIKGVIQPSGEIAPANVDIIGEAEVYAGYDITSIRGKGRISQIIIENQKEKETLDCDTLIFANGWLSDGVVAMKSKLTLNPATTGPKVDENYETSMPGVFACGNGICIHQNIEEIETEVEQLMKYIKLHISSSEE